jgi:hypothetical protein
MPSTLLTSFAHFVLLKICKIAYSPRFASPGFSSALISQPCQADRLGRVAFKRLAGSFRENPLEPGPAGS